MSTILLVEDDAGVRQVVRQMLSKQGYLILEAGSVPQALDCIERHGEPIDLLITDVVLPKVRCTRLVERLKTKWPLLKVLYISGYAGESLAPYGLKKKEPNFLQKPFAPETLVAKVKSMLGGAPAQTQAAGQS